MPCFVCRLVPSRPRFPFDMNGRGREVTGAHLAYLQAKGAEDPAVRGDIGRSYEISPIMSVAFGRTEP